MEDERYRTRGSEGRPSKAVGGRPQAGSLRRERLEAWFATKPRRFPWRDGLTPWGIFLAEMLLRRTRADQVARNLPAVLERYPGPGEMAADPVSEVEKALRPFGLNWRARTLHAAATQLVARHSSSLPSSVNEMMTLPGVGPYVAAATLAALTDEDVILVDTNTVRVAARVAGCYRPGDIRRTREVQQAIRDLLEGPAPAASWWGVLDLAATICLPGRPSCLSCPIRNFCVTGSAAMSSSAQSGSS
jgi:A/G-specific adenine glycosylase